MSSTEDVPLTDEEEVTPTNTENGESPIKILVNLYSVIAGLASVTAVKFLVSPNNVEIRNPFSIPLIDLLSFLLFFCFIIPFYQGAITYLHDTYDSKHHGKKFDILVDFLHLLAEGMVFYAISASLIDILLFLSWLFVLIFIDTLWITSIILRSGMPSPEIKRTRIVWMLLNLGSFLFLLFMWILYTTNPNIVVSIQGYVILFFFSLLRTILDYIFTKSFYFG